MQLFLDIMAHDLQKTVDPHPTVGEQLEKIKEIIYS